MRKNDWGERLVGTSSWEEFSQINRYLDNLIIVDRNCSFLVSANK